MRSLVRWPLSRLLTNASVKKWNASVLNRMSWRSCRSESQLLTKTKKELLRLLRSNTDNRYNWNKTPKSIRLCWERKRSKTKSNERVILLVFKTVSKTSMRFRTKSILESRLKLRPEKSIWKNATRSTPLSREWFRRTARWPASKTSKCNKLRLIWSCRWMRNVHSFVGSKRWKLTRMRWFVSTPSNSNNVWTRFRQLKTRLKRPVMPFSRNWKLKRWLDAKKLSSVRTSEMNYTTKRMSWLLGNASKTLKTREKTLNASCKMLKTSKCVWKLSALPKKNGWKKTSNRSCWPNSPKTKDSSKWPNKNAACASKSTEEK